MEKVLDEKIIEKLRQNHVNFVAVFGSRAKNTANDSSDFDLLVDIDPNAKFSLFDQVGLKDDLESILNNKVDLVTVGGLNRFIKDEILRTMKVVYDERKR